MCGTVILTGRGMSSSPEGDLPGHRDPPSLPQGPVIALTGRGPSRPPAAGHLPAVGIHAPAGAPVIPALDGPTGRKDTHTDSVTGALSCNPA